MAGQLERDGDRVDQTAGQLGRRNRVAFQHLDDRELVAAHPRDRVVGPHIQPKTLGHGSEELVAHQVTARVVDGLEPIEVEIEQCDPVFPLYRIAQCGHESFLEHNPVRQLCQVVVMCHVARPLFRHFAKQRRADRIGERRHVGHHLRQVNAALAEGK